MKKWRGLAAVAMIFSLVVGATTLAQGARVCPHGNVKYEVPGGYEYSDGSGWIEADEFRVCWGANEGYQVVGVCVYIGGPDKEERLTSLGPGDGCWDNPEKYGVSHVVLYTEAIPEPTPTDVPPEPTSTPVSTATPTKTPVETLPPPQPTATATPVETIPPVTPTPTEGVEPTPTPTPTKEETPVPPEPTLTPEPTKVPPESTPTEAPPTEVPPTQVPPEPTPTPTPTKEETPVPPEPTLTPEPTEAPVPEPTPEEEVLLPPTGGGGGQSLVIPVLLGLVPLALTLIALRRRKAQEGRESLKERR